MALCSGSVLLITHLNLIIHPLSPGHHCCQESQEQCFIFQKAEVKEFISTGTKTIMLAFGAKWDKDKMSRTRKLAKPGTLREALEITFLGWKYGGIF